MNGKPMPHPTLTQTATFACFVMRGHVDGAGVPIQAHVERVVAGVARLFPECNTATLHVAWLHDVVEDTGMGCEDLRRIGYSDTVVHSVRCLTQGPYEPYSVYIDRMCMYGNLSALRVKVADVRDNADPVRMERTAKANPDKAKFLRARYAGVQERLAVALVQRDIG